MDVNKKAEAYDRLRNYQRDFIKKNYRQILIRFNVNTDAEVLAKLDEQTNKTDYIRSLILKDMKENDQ